MFLSADLFICRCKFFDCMFVCKWHRVRERESKMMMSLFSRFIRKPNDVFSIEICLFSIFSSFFSRSFFYYYLADRQARLIHIVIIKYASLRNKILIYRSPMEKNDPKSTSDSVHLSLDNAKSSTWIASIRLRKDQRH